MLLQVPVTLKMTLKRFEQEEHFAENRLQEERLIWNIAEESLLW
jgi:hypothetical protein